MTVIYSHSRLGAFENCPFMYKLRYLDNIRVERDTIERFLGNAVHKTLEKIYGNLSENIERTEEETIKWYDWWWKTNQKKIKNLVIVKKQYDEPHYRDIGEKALRRYHKAIFSAKKNKILGLEQKIHIRLDEAGKYIMTGVIDRLDEAADGSVEIHDYKTGMNAPSEADIKKDRQLALYQIGILDLMGKDKKISLVWHYLMPGIEYNLVKTEQELSRVKTETAAAIDEVEAADEFPMKKSGLCNYCDYYGTHCTP